MSPTQLSSDHAQQVQAALFAEPFLGNLGQVLAPGVPARSNTQYLGLAGHANGAIAATGVCLAVPIPVVPGDYLSQVTLLVATTAASTPTHQFAALYSGIAVPARLAQSADATTAAVAANAAYTFTLSAPVLVTQANAPNGYIYASVSFTASTIPSALGVAIPTGGNAYQWTTTSPLFLSMTHGSAVAGTAPSTIASPAVVSPAPYVILS